MHGLLAAAMLCGQLGPDDKWPLVESHVDTIAIAEWIEDGHQRRIYFFDYVQDEWWCLDTRYERDDMLLASNDDGSWTMTWRDDQDDCDRAVTAEVLMWTYGVRADDDDDGRQWMFLRLQPGLPQPPPPPPKEDE